MKLAKQSDDKYVVDAVVKALDVLETFHDSEELALKDISKRVGLNKSRAFRLLHTLCERGYIDRASDGQGYKLGVKLFEHAFNHRRDVKHIAQPYMRQLQSRFNETVNLAVLHNGEVLYIDLLESSRAFRMSAMIGSRMPIAKTSLGKAIMAYAPEDELKKFIDSLTAWEARKVKSELLVIRRNGYATDREENEPGVACVGAPVFNSAGHAVAAMSVSGPSVRMLKQEREVGSTLVSTCIEMSRRIGFSSQPVTALAARRVQS